MCDTQSQTHLKTEDKIPLPFIHPCQPNMALVVVDKTTVAGPFLFLATKAEKGPISFRSQ